MKDFIVWDKIHNKFLNIDFIQGIVFDNGKLHYIATNRKPKGLHSDLFNEEVEFLYDIGLKDSGGNVIYPDSSICKVNYFSSSDWISDYCYFSFDTENFRYVVHLINEKEIVDYEASYFDCLEIIDTIQENKLGLIK